jgi:biopolymer transport protein ExbB
MTMIFRNLFPARSSMVRWLLCTLLALTVLAPHRAEAWWNSDWSYRTKITVSAGQLPPGRMPLLVRLHDGNFKFTDAKEDGSDIRFVASDDKTPLRFHIESYDSVLGIAFIWVDVPAAAGGGPTEIWLYHKNDKATVGADPRGTYDADTALVWHFVERNAPPRDQTANDTTATSPARSIDTALIGRGAHFDGNNTITLPAAPSLAVQAGGALSWSAWFKPSGAGGGILYARRDGANGLVIGLDQGRPYVAVTTNGVETKGAAADVIAPGGWHHIAIAASTQVILYVDGKLAATIASTLPALNSGASLGGDAVPPAGTTAAHYAGDIDELEISKIARAPAFFAAAFASQGPDGQMLSFGEGEENAGMSGGYFGVILRSVTLDGWVVISILAVMAVISVLVMISKTRAVNSIAGANKRFLVLFEQAGSDIARLQALLAKDQTGRLKQSVLHRISEAAMLEIAHRTAHGGLLVLNGPAVATIRAKLDRVSAYESRRLNSMMVLLTIAISGGPFLGLLGTVVGVMITFAAIAASGDVNINAIAPGIAAALVATVAGLAVAIPALFGYNYLITRIKDITTEMHVFTDELVTRLAEAYAPRDTTGMAAE